MLIITVFMCSVTIFILFVAIFSGMGKNTDQTRKRLEGLKGTSEKSEKKQKDKKKLSERRKISRSEKRDKINVRKKRKEKSNKKTSAVENMLMVAGYNMSAEQFSMLKIILSAVFMGIAVILCKALNLNTVYLMLCMAGFGLMAMIIPGRILTNKIKKRQEKIREELPDIMDLLVVSVEAGLGFDAAIIRLYEKNKTIMMEEMMQAIRDIQRGMKKKDAYSQLANRCNVKELTAFLTALVQADQMGISIKSVLKVQAESLRKDRRRRAEEKALKAPVIMLVPMVMFIFPIIFIILLGPAVLNIMEAMG